VGLVGSGTVMRTPWARTRRAAVRAGRDLSLRLRAGRLALAGAILAGAAAGQALADDLSGYVEISGTAASSQGEVGGVLQAERDTTSLRPA